MLESKVDRLARVFKSHGVRGILKGMPRAFETWRRARIAGALVQRDDARYREILKTLPIDNDGFTEINVHGNTMKLLASDPGLTRDLLLNNGIREPGATRIMQALLRGDMTILEVGANQGYYLLQEAAQTSAASRIYAFEPHPLNVQILKENIRLNGFQDRIRLTHAAVSNQVGEVELVSDACSNFHRIASEVDHAREGTQIIKVQCISLDNFCLENGIKAVDLIRMDVEGYEAHIVDGAQNILRESPNCILFLELHTQLIRNLGRDPLQLLNQIRDLGLGCFALTGHGSKQLNVETLPWKRLLRDLPFLLHDYGAHMFFSKTPDSHASVVRCAIAKCDGG